MPIFYTYNIFCYLIFLVKISKKTVFIDILNEMEIQCYQGFIDFLKKLKLFLANYLTDC